MQITLNSPPAYILCQTPIQSTIDDHWRRVIQQNVNLIVILTSFMENGIKKCIKYLPELNKNKVVCENYEIKTINEVILSDIAHITLTITNNATASCNEILILHYLAWPDNGVPINVWGIIELLEISNEQRNKHLPSSCRGLEEVELLLLLIY
ncbi:hypothetical protein HZS_1761 [Henneguya salminicola]|nr:hypothetical protein HZS_1761 [Henneguya salminicola]